MDLSVIIVNYNVKYFLEQCLCSVKKAIEPFQAEVIVVDNCSSDNSLVYLEPRFHWVHFIGNTSNLGFAKANNQALKIARGRYILFLNPDTIVPEDCFVKCIGFLSANAVAGALGVRMLDGAGRFLKESKRSFPSPLISFYRLVGLARLFPRSKVFARYNLGHLDPDKDHEIDVLAGAFMMIKKEVLDITGGFDETFFMYGEDVDLSFRIQQAGFKNYYFSKTSILHFKGESTKKGSLNYVRLFYRAMSLFVKKHYSGARGGLFRLFIELAIWTRAMLTAISTFLRKIGWPLIDAFIILLSFWLAKFTWNRFFKPEINYSARLLTLALPVFTIIYLVAAYYAGLYDSQKRKFRIIRSMLIATLAVLAAYSLLPEQYRFSRAIMLLGSFFSFVLMSFFRMLFKKLSILENGEDTELLQTLAAGSAEEYRAVVKLMQHAGIQGRMLGRIAPTEDNREKLTTLKELDVFLKTVPVKEIIFCEGTLSFKEIIQSIDHSARRNRVRIFSSGSGGIIGSDSKDSSGSIISNEITFSLAQPFNRRIKRLLDFCFAIALFLSFPLQIFLVKKPVGLIKNIFDVLLGKKTWIGYATGGSHLPPLREGIFITSGLINDGRRDGGDAAFRIDYRYALEYGPGMDFRLLWRNYINLGGVL